MLNWTEYCKTKTFLVPHSTTNRIGPWMKHLLPYRETFTDVWDVGSFEGQSACFWLEWFPKATVTCIDTWRGSPEMFGGQWPEILRTLETRFDINVSSYAGRVQKAKMTSHMGLAMLFEAGKRADLIYIDADHDPTEVLVDSFLAFKCLREGGIIIWDDYHMDWQNPNLQPKPAIDMVMHMLQRYLRPIAETDHQLMAQRWGGDTSAERVLVDPVRTL